MKRLRKGQEPDGSQDKFQTLKAVATLQPAHCGLAGHVHMMVQPSCMCQLLI